MGHLNEKGVYIYDETDNPPTFSELINLGQNAESDGKAYFVGTSAQRLALDPAPAGAMWQDTDNGEKLWSTAPNGKWRRHEGIATFAAGGWSTAATNIYYRTQTVTIPTVLAANESILVAFAFTSGNSWVSVNGITRNATDTVLSLRILQISTTAVQVSGDISWRVVKGA